MQRARPPADAPPLHDAAFNGKIDEVKYLLEARADPLQRDSNRLPECPEGCTPLIYAVNGKHASIVDLLLIAKPFSKEHKNVALHLAERNDDADSATVLLKHGADIESRSLDGLEYTPLYSSVDSCHFKSTEALINAKADINAKHHRGEAPTAIFIPVLQTKVLMLRMLLNGKADLDVCDHWGNTLLHRAILTARDWPSLPPNPHLLNFNKYEAADIFMLLRVAGVKYSQHTLLSLANESPRPHTPSISRIIDFIRSTTALLLGLHVRCGSHSPLSILQRRSPLFDPQVLRITLACSGLIQQTRPGPLPLPSLPSDEQHARNSGYSTS